jgi:hypothetical protein
MSLLPWIHSRTHTNTPSNVVNGHITVMAHSEFRPLTMYRLHEKHWKKSGFPILPYSPKNKAIKGGLVFGLACHNGGESIRRFKFLLNHLSTLPHDWFWIHEYDSVDLAPEQWTEGEYIRGVHGNYAYCVPEPPFTAPIYIHPPLLFDKESLLRVAAHMAKMDDRAEGGFWDRYLGRAVVDSGVAQRPFGKRGWSRNTIEAGHMEEVAESVKGGAHLFHGIKDPQTLKTIYKLVKERNP